MPIQDASRGWTYAALYSFACLVSRNIISWSFITAIISSFVKAENCPVECLYHFSICLSIGGHSGCLPISSLPASCCSGHECANWRSFSLDFVYTGPKIQEVYSLPKSPSQKVTKEVFEPGSTWLYSLSCFYKDTHFCSGSSWGWNGESCNKKG